MDRASRELLVKRLRELQTNTTDVEASAVVSVDGLIIASSLPGGVEEDRVSAMSAAMLSRRRHRQDGRMRHAQQARANDGMKRWGGISGPPTDFFGRRMSGTEVRG